MLSYAINLLFCFFRSNFFTRHQWRYYILILVSLTTHYLITRALQTWKPVKLLCKALSRFFGEFWFLVLSRKEYFSHDKILGGDNNVFDSLFQRIDNKFKVSLQCNVFLHFASNLQSAVFFCARFRNLLNYLLTNYLLCCCSCHISMTTYL